MRARLNPPPAPLWLGSEEVPLPADGLTDEGVPLVYCRHCCSDHPVSAVRALSTHPTSQGVVTYFRCPAGHADFFTTTTRR